MNTVLKLLRLKSYPSHRANVYHARRCFILPARNGITYCGNECQFIDGQLKHGASSRHLSLASTSISAIQQICIRNYAKESRKESKQKKGGKPKVILSDEEISVVINILAFREKLVNAVERLKEDYVKHLSVRTSTGSIETLPVDFEGEEYPLNQIAQVSRKNPNLFILNMSSFPQAIRAVLDAIQKSGMNLNPQQEGTTLYLPIPPITREYRENLVKNARVLLNKTKDELHDIQNHAIKVAKSKKEDFSEDLIYNIQQQIVFITESSISQAESVFSKKQTDLLGGK